MRIDDLLTTINDQCLDWFLGLSVYDCRGVIQELEQDARACKSSCGNDESAREYAVALDGVARELSWRHDHVSDVSAELLTISGIRTGDGYYPDEYAARDYNTKVFDPLCVIVPRLRARINDMNTLADCSEASEVLNRIARQDDRLDGMTRVCEDILDLGRCDI